MYPTKTLHQERYFYGKPEEDKASAGGKSEDKLPDNSVTLH